MGKNGAETRYRSCTERTGVFVLLRCSLFCIATISLFAVVRLSVFIKASAGRNCINVSGEVNAITKEVVTITNITYITSATLIDFLKLLRKKFTDKPIAIVLDHACCQHCFAVTTFAKSSSIHLLFLPPYSLNLNIIEHLWKFTKLKLYPADFTPIRFK